MAKTFQDDRAVTAFRSTFQRTLNEGETQDKTPRTSKGWPCARDFRKWPIADQQEWVCAPVVAWLEEALSASEAAEDGPAMREAWQSIVEFLEHVGIDTKAPSLLGDASAAALLFEHYKRGERYDCEQVAMDYLTFPPNAQAIRELRRRKSTQDESRREGKRASKRRRRDNLAVDCGAVDE